MSVYAKAMVLLKGYCVYNLFNFFRRQSMKKVNNDNNSNCNVDNMLILVKKIMQKQHREKDDVAT